MSAWTCRWFDGKAAAKIVPPRHRTPRWKGLSADSGEKHEPASDIDTAVVDSLKALDPNRPLEKQPSSCWRSVLCACHQPRRVTDPFNRVGDIKTRAKTKLSPTSPTSPIGRRVMRENGRSDKRFNFLQKCLPPVGDIEVGGTTMQRAETSGLCHQSQGTLVTRESIRIRHRNDEFSCMANPRI